MRSVRRAEQALELGRVRGDHLEGRDQPGRRPRRDDAGLVAAIEGLASRRSRVLGGARATLACGVGRAAPAPEAAGERARRRQAEQQPAAVGAEASGRRSSSAAVSRDRGPG